MISWIPVVLGDALPPVRKDQLGFLAVTQAGQNRSHVEKRWSRGGWPQRLVLSRSGDRRDAERRLLR